MPFDKYIKLQYTRPDCDTFGRVFFSLVNTNRSVPIGRNIVKLSRIWALGLAAVMATAMLGCDDSSPAPRPQQTVAQGATISASGLPPAVQQNTDDADAVIKATDLTEIFGVPFALYAHHTYQQTAHNYAYRGGRWDIKVNTMTGMEAVNGWSRIQTGIGDGTLSAYQKVPAVHSSALVLHGSLTTVQICLSCTKSKASQAKYLIIEANVNDSSADSQLFQAVKLAVSRMQLHCPSVHALRGNHFYVFRAAPYPSHISISSALNIFVKYSKITSDTSAQQ